jgi:cyclohexanone monooxygenase
MMLDLSEYQRGCPPGYFNNEGEDNPKWALFRVYGPGWDAFQKKLEEWRKQGDMAGMVLA